MIGPAPLCLKCKHLIDDPNRFVCRAFPDGIPEFVVLGLNDHRRPIPGDNEIQFEPAEDVTKNVTGTV